jgi:hypothetical protein
VHRIRQAGPMNTLTEWMSETGWGIAVVGGVIAAVAIILMVLSIWLIERYGR